MLITNSTVRIIGWGERLSISCGKLRALPPLCDAGGGFSMIGCELGIG